MEIGPGSGIISIALKSRGATEVVAVDGHDVDSFRMAVELSGQDVEYRTGGVESIRQEQQWRGGFDLVVSTGLMYHLINPFQLVDAAKFVLKDRGLFVLQSFTHGPTSPAALFFNTRENLNGDHSTFMIPNVSGMKAMMSMAFFDCIAEAFTMQLPKFWAILGISVANSDKVRSATHFEKYALKKFEARPDYPYGGYVFRDYTASKSESIITCDAALLNAPSPFVIDLNKDAVPSFPFQPRRPQASAV
jgi:hypothetical protein